MSFRYGDEFILDTHLSHALDSYTKLEGMLRDDYRQVSSCDSQLEYICRGRKVISAELMKEIKRIELKLAIWPRSALRGIYLCL